MTERVIRAAARMTGPEAMMWAVEADPTLSSAFLNLTFLDGPVDFDAFRQRMAEAVATIPRLRQRVVPSGVPWTPPAWEEDTDFDLDRHVVAAQVGSSDVGGAGDDRAVLDLAAAEYQEPFDLTRPLWRFTVVGGLVDGRGVLLAKMHHTISDGVGAIRLSAMFTDVERHPAPRPRRSDHTSAALGVGEHDLPPIPDERSGPGLGEAVAGLARWAAGRARRRVTQPQTLPQDLADAVDAARNLGKQVLVRDASRSPLWKERSADRRFEILSVPFEPARDAAKAMGGTLNDLLVCAVADGAGRYHRLHGSPVDELRMSMPVSTRQDKSAGGNAFAPTRVIVPTGELDPRERFRRVHELLSEAKDDRSLGAAETLFGMVAALPAAVLLPMARQQTGTVDFAVSNTRGAPFDLFIGGAMVLANHPMGPTGGTAFNATLLSYRGNLDIGLAVDAAAVLDAPALAAAIRDAFDDLIGAGRT